MSRRSILLAAFLFVCAFSYSQAVPEKWDIVRCVDHALKNNITVRQTDLQAKFSELTYHQNRASQYPSLNFSGSVGYRLGRSENPTTGVLEDNNFLNTGMQLQSQVNLFNWFSQKNAIAASKLSWEADRQQYEKTRNDIALNVATAYLQILLAKEQVNISAVQITQTKTQLDITRKRVDAGSLPELNAAEFEAQLARDSATYVTAVANEAQARLMMKAILNLDAGLPFDIVTPPVEAIPVLPLAELQPEAVYASALANLPQQKVNELRLQSAMKSVASAKGAMYPSISAFGSLGSNAISFKRPIYDQVITGYSTSSGIRANAGGGVFYPVEVPIVTEGTNVVGYFRPGSITEQFQSNFGQSVGLGISVPIFNGKQARTAWERAKLTVSQWKLTQELDNQTLKQDIYSAYNDAMAALQRYNANKKAVETATKAYDFATKRYEVALLSTFELMTSQNNLQRSKIDLVYAQYDYIFKIKLLEFYKGQGLIL